MIYELVTIIIILKVENLRLKNHQLVSADQELELWSSGSGFCAFIYYTAIKKNK